MLIVLRIYLLKMKTKYHLNKVNKKRSFSKIILWSGLTALFLFFLVARPMLSEPLTSLGLTLTEPFLKFRLKTEDWKDYIFALFQDKGKIIEENSLLKERISELEVRVLAASMLENENKTLLSFLGNSEERNFIISSIIFRSPQINHDTLIIDAGHKQGIKVGMQVTAYGKVLLGHITEVSPSSSKVRLISFSGEETNVVFQNVSLSALALGRGGENLEVVLPRSIEVEAGEPIVSLGVDPLLIGLAERIEKDETSPLQKIIFRLPLNINYLRYVLVNAS